MAGCLLRIDFSLMQEDTKYDIRQLCTKYGITPECSHPGGMWDNMSFDFGDDIESRDAFSQEMCVLLEVTVDKNKRRVFGHRVKCPL